MSAAHIQIIQADITTLGVDAIVNAANTLTNEVAERASKAHITFAMINGPVKAAFERALSASLSVHLNK